MSSFAEIEVINLTNVLCSWDRNVHGRTLKRCELSNKDILKNLLNWSIFVEPNGFFKQNYD